MALVNAAKEHGIAGVIGPRVCSLRDFVSEECPPPLTLIDNPSRELMLYRALKHQQSVFGDISTWLLVDNLLSLFDELTLAKVNLPKSEGEFIDEISRAYGMEENNLNPLSREAKIVYTLWCAYYDELNAHQKMDKEMAYQNGLQQLQEQSLAESFYVAGYHRLSPAEISWLKQLDKKQQLRLILHSEPAEQSHACPPSMQLLIENFRTQGVIYHSDYRQFLNNVYGNITDTSLLTRAKAFSEQHPKKNIQQQLSISEHISVEKEAEAVALQLAIWRDQGMQDLAIVTEDRRLARRIRALLERYGLSLNDYTGWALSTTSAAAALESWLNCIEQDFAYQPLLSLLKSPFILPNWDQEERSKACFRFEQDIIRHENIQANLNRYRFYIRLRQQRLNWQNNLVTEILDELEFAAEPLLEVFAKETSLSELLGALELSLQRIGLSQTLQNDVAGQTVIDTLTQLHPQHENTSEPLNWQEFRLWLARSLENSYFQLERQDGSIALLPITQSNLERFDGLVIAAADANHLPMVSAASPLFNQAVRAELGLRTLNEERQTMLYHFRRLLESASQVHITYATDNHGEPQSISPWVELLNAFHQLSYGDDLHDDSLSYTLSEKEKLLKQNAKANGHSDPASTAVLSQLLPDIYSAYSYQEIINCPYRFYLSQCLKLAAPEEIREALQKADYGELIHRCLQALHSHVSGLSGPFNSAFSTATRQDAITLLNQISEQVFTTELEQNSIHRVWLTRWQRQIPAYIDWQIKQAKNSSKVIETEIAITTEAEPNKPQLKGRLDRIDSNDDGEVIIDYKTGGSAAAADILDGESVQLPFYTMLRQSNTIACKYVTIDDKIKETVIEQPELSIISELNHERLNTIHLQLKNNQAVTAWGDDIVCRYCDYQGVCRKQSVTENH